ncbi:MAG: glycoside hydrolase family 9 protein [Myxococcota bacterium]
MGTSDGSSNPSKTVYLGHQTTSGTPAPAMPGQNVPAIKVNTVGYPSAWRKIAIFNTPPKSPQVVTEPGGEVVATLDAAKADDRGMDEASADPVWQVDFTSVQKPGTYRIVDGQIRSDPFTVGDEVYSKALVAGLKHFYFQRTRTALVEPYARWEGTSYIRKGVSHAHDDVGWDLMHYPDKKHRFELVGGWHDAGNYDMYVPSTAPTVQALLMAYEMAPKRFADNHLTIPESGNGTPDLLDEARWGLDWILSMQEPGGAFRHREAVMEFSPEGPADTDKTERWVAGVSTAATAKAVAALALAARVYKGHDKAYANRCAKAAKAGWKWMQEHPERVIVDGKGSPQPLWDDEPGYTDVGAKLVAAAEMWASFNEPTALELYKKLLAEPEATPEKLVTGAWSNLSRWALGTMAQDGKAPKAVSGESRTRLLAAAESMREQIESKDGYRCASSPAEYYWAHNSNLMEKTYILAIAARLDPGSSWLPEAARDQWHWVLGRNPNGYSMVTRIGKGPERMYHMEWGAMEPPPPGYLIGGPNADNLGFLAPGAPAKALLWENPEPLRSGLPAGSMWHWRQSDLWDGGFVPEGKWDEGWWAVTEPDIYYNANLVLAQVAIP